MLAFELVPSTCWWSNVRSQVSKANWERCKRFVRKRSGDRCEICGGVGHRWPVEAHEIWSYDDEEQIQTLVGLIALCPTCHAAKHIGRTQTVSTPAQLDRVYRHIMKVNGWSPSQLQRALDNVFAVWEIRSSWEWDLDVSWLETIGVELPQYTWARGAR